MKKLYLYLLTLILTCQTLQSIGQQDCCTAEPLFGPLTVTIQGNSGNGTFENVSGCSCLATNEHDSYWFAFECTTSGSFEMMITPANLGADFDFALYSVACPCDPNTVVVSCDYTGPITPPGPFVPTGIASDPMTSFGVPGLTEFQPTVTLIAGNVYYIIADNITTNGNGFTIEFGGTAQIGPPPFLPPPGPPGPITGELTSCPGATLPYQVPNDPFVSSWEWTVDPPQAVINGNGTNEVEITWTTEGSYNVCVTSSTGCETSVPFCIPVLVTPIITVPVTDQICLGGSYEAPSGETFYEPGSFEMNFTSYQGCDSIVPLILTPIIPPLTVLPPEEICEGDCLSFDGQLFCETTVYEALLTNWQGCDSTVIFNLIVVPNQAVINGGGTVSCNGDPVVLDGSLSLGGANLTYEWTNEAGLVISTQSTILVDEPGDYTLTVTSEIGSGTCTDSETITVDSNSDPPENLTATGGVLTCTVSSVTLMGNSTSQGVSFFWSGPGGFTSSEQNPVTSVTGTYVLTVTGTNGCTGTAFAMVDGDSSVPSAVAVGDTLSCMAATVFLSGNSNAQGASYAWTGPAGFVSAEQNPEVGVSGNYTLTVTAPNGCSAQATAVVLEDFLDPDAFASGGEIDCTNSVLTLSGNSTTQDVSYSWNGPAGFTSTLQNPDVTVAGAYILTVTAANGCTGQDTALVIQNADLPDVIADGGLIDCQNPVVTLSGDSGTPGVTWSWTGPGGFSSSEQNPTTTLPGTYTLTVTAVNGCSAQDGAIVDEDTAVPDVTATGGVLTCTTGSVVINGNSTTPGVTFSWVGPGGETYNEQNPTVSQAGDYTLTVTAANGCTAVAVANVQQDAGLPSVSASGGTLDCNNTSIVITGSSNTPGVTYAWTGPGGFSSGTALDTVDVPGNYILTVTSANNCTSQATAVVQLNNLIPDLVASGNTLTCDSTSVMIFSQSNTPGVTTAWSGPNGFASGLPNPVVSEPGDYTLTLTGTNGCTNSMMVQVDEDVTVPDVTAAGGLIDCSQPVAPLNGSSATPGAVYLWTGPGGFVADTPDTLVSVPGTYFLQVTGLNGCTSQDAIEILTDLAPPLDVDATGGILSCQSPALVLTGNTTSTGVTFSWTGPGGFASSAQNPMVDVPGSYVLTVTGANGCTDSDLAVVGEDADAPDASAAGGIITCSAPAISLTGSSGTPGVSYQWSGPGGFTANGPAPVASQAGMYTLTVTASNGCTTLVTAQVDEDVLPPDATAAGGVLTCTAGTLELQGNSQTPGVVYAWTGPNGFVSNEQNPVVDIEGTYNLTVTALNGCTSVAAAEVLEDANAPVVTVTDAEINCSQPSINLNGQSPTPGVQYAWTGPGGFFSDLPNPVVTEAGAYSLTVTAPNGCETTAAADVTADFQPPDINAAGGLITCQNPSIQLSASSGTSNVTYFWTGPGGFTSNVQQPLVSEGGTYQLVVTASNGCTSTASAEVMLDADVPVVSASGGTLTCLVTQVQLTGTSNQPDGVFSWTGPGGFSSNLPDPLAAVPGTYTLTVTTASGCSATANVWVDEQIELPAVSIESPDMLTCDVLTVTLDGSASDQGAGYQLGWSTINGNIVSGENTLTPVVDAPGTYTLEIINQLTGCSNIFSVEVPVSADAPSGAVILNNPPSCFGTSDGLIVIESVEGGTPPYLFSLNNAPFTGESFFTSLEPGNYSLIIQDASGCEWEDEISLSSPGPVSANLVAAGLSGEPVPLGESIKIDVQLGIPLDRLGSIEWTPEAVMEDCPEPCLSIVDTPFETTLYSVIVRDTNGCAGVSELLVLVDRRRPVFVPNAFTPNGDGINDLLTVFGGGSVAQVRQFVILSRWGETVYQYTNFQPNNPAIGWDGTHRGKPLDVGVFTWFAEIEFIDGETSIFEGDVTLVR